MIKKTIFNEDTVSVFIFVFPPIRENTQKYDIFFTLVLTLYLTVIDHIGVYITLYNYLLATAKN